MYGSQPLNTDTPPQTGDLKTISITNQYFNQTHKVTFKGAVCKKCIFICQQALRNHVKFK